MKLTDFINFAPLKNRSDNFLDDMIRCKKNPKHVTYTTKEIVNVDDKHVDVGENLICDAVDSFREYSKIKNKYIKISPLEDAGFFKSLDNRFYLAIINLLSETVETSLQLIGLFEIGTGKYITLGTTDGNCLFLRSDTFDYIGKAEKKNFNNFELDHDPCEHDGEKISSKTTLFEILRGMIDYYDMICENNIW